MKKAFLLYPHQLFEDIALLKKYDIVYLIEDPIFFSEFPFHKQKLMLHRASMKAYEAYLKAHDIQSIYIEHHQIQKNGDIADMLTTKHIASVAVYDVTDEWLSQRLKTSLKAAHIEYIVNESPMFLTSNTALRDFFAARTGARKYFMNDFYIWQRKRLNILVENGKPTGGKWNFDSENRKKLPKKITIPNTFFPNTSAFVDEARAYIERYFPKNFGETTLFWCPVTHAEATKHLHEFLKHRFANFGTYEDAMTTASASVFHSTISPLLNNGLLTPDAVLAEVFAYTKNHEIPIAALEGFVRQIIGWREYIRAMYILEGNTIRTKNYFNAQQPLPKSFWTGDTGIEPVDHHIALVKTYAYTHHIPRLMVLGNCMNLCHIKPDAVYSWFMEVYIDAYDWVMVPNVYSMALYADGGILTTKPYIASSNYISNMSDFTKGNWCAIFDSLFWNFVGMHFEKLQKEGRLGFIGVQYAKMSEEKKAEHTQNATRFLSNFLDRYSK